MNLTFNSVVNSLITNTAGATFTDLWTHWPAATPKPSRATFYRLLKRAWCEK